MVDKHIEIYKDIYYGLYNILNILLDFMKYIL